jgi:mannose/fructose/N-acetylgalactosamine-specific phosphotransferase system component IIC
VSIAGHIATAIAIPMATIIAVFEPYRRSIETHKARRAKDATEMKATANDRK